jgi:hypothetical protein
MSVNESRHDRHAASVDHAHAGNIGRTRRNRGDAASTHNERTGLDDRTVSNHDSRIRDRQILRQEILHRAQAAGGNNKSHYKYSFHLIHPWI